MSEISREKAFDRAVDLVIHLDHEMQGWARHFMLIQAGLGIAVGTILGWKNSQPTALIVMFSVILAVFGFVFAISIPLLMERASRWQALYIAMVKRAEGDNPILYQEDQQLSGPTFRMVFIASGFVLAAGWVAVVAELVRPISPRFDLVAASFWLGIVALMFGITALIVSVIALLKCNRNIEAG